MANGPSANMNKIAQSLVMILTTSESLLGICCNSFIWLVNSISLVKSKKMSLSEFVITRLAISRITLLWLIIADILILFENDLQEPSIGKIIRSSLWFFANYLSISLATCLSILYCLKIANFSHHAILWLKWRVSHVVRWILLTSVLFSFFNTLILTLKFEDTFHFTQMAPTANYTQDIKKKKRSYFSKYIFITSLTIMPFFLSLISFVLILLSLRRHIQQMQNNGTGSKDPSIEAHVRATKIILSFLFFFIMYLVAFILMVWVFIFPGPYVAWMAGEMILAAHPSIHSVILILGNKLKQVFLGIFLVKK